MNIYVCMNCGVEWETSNEDYICPICHTPDICLDRIEEENEEQNKVEQ